MNTSFFIAQRIALKSKRTFSKTIVRIAVIGIMLSLAVMIIAVAVVKGFKHEIRQKVRGFSNDILLSSYEANSSYENIPFVLNDTTLNTLKQHQNVLYFQTFATKPAIISANGEIEGVNFKGVSTAYRFQFLSSHLLEGKILDTSTEKRNAEIMISNYTANRMKLKVGDSFIIYFVQDPPRKRKFKVVGIYSIGVDEIDKSFVIGDIDVVRKINKWNQNQIGGVEVGVKNFDMLDSTTQKLYQDVQIDIASSSVKNTYSVIFEWLDLLDINTKVILILMILVGLINMISALLIMILERTNMIGVMKAIGAGDYLLMRVFMINATFLIGLGVILGNILGLGLCWFQASTQFFKLDQASYYISWVPVKLEFWDVVWLNTTTIVICVITMLLPVYLVAKISPIKAIVFK